MKFEVEGDNAAILKALEQHIKEFEEEYRKQVQGAKEMLRGFGMTGSDMFPDEFPMFFWEENGKVIIRIAMYTPRILKVLRRDKRQAKKFKEFFEEMGVKVTSCEYVGD